MNKKNQNPCYSISAFFPCYNDGGTIASMVMLVNDTLSKLTSDYEIIVIDDGSVDCSHDILAELEQHYPNLSVIYHGKNKGYGAALQTGFAAASKDLIFYTDGDQQYDVAELPKLYSAFSEDIDVVNGYKIVRHDPFYRIVIGKIYQYLIKIIFNLKIKDVDCDFRLIRRQVFDYVELEYTSGVICVEMIRKIQDAGFRFAEVPVNHYFRSYGKSQFFNFKRLFHVAIDLISLWWKLVINKEEKKEKITVARQLQDESTAK